MNFCLKMPDFHVTFRDLLLAVNVWHGTNGFTSLPKEGVLRIFFALKNPTASAGFEPANLGTKGQHATSRPLKPLKLDYSPFIFLELLASLWMKQIGLAIESCCVGALKLETESIYSWESRSLESDKLGEKFCTHVSPKLQTYDRLLVFHHLSKYVRKIKYLVLGVNKKRNSIPMKNYSKLFIVLS